MNWNIICDSSIDLFKPEHDAHNIRFATVPFTLTVGNTSFVDDENLDKPTLLREMKDYSGASTSACPSTGAWLDEFEKDGNVIALTITSGLSGSHGSACAAKELLLEREPDRKIYVIDSLSTGAESILILRKLYELIAQGLDFEAVIEGVEKFKKTSRTVFVLCCFDNLVKNGRMSKLKGFVANKLGFWGIGIASEIGTIEMKGVARGQKKALDIIMDDIRERCPDVKSLIIDHCYNEEFAGELAALVRAEWPDCDISTLPTRGLCSYYAEKGGLIIGYCP